MGMAQSQWRKGTVFLIPLQDGTCGVGQIITDEVMGSPTVAIYSVRFPCSANEHDMTALVRDQCIALITLLGLQALKKGKWRPVGVREIALNSSQSENWKFRGANWVGSKLYSDTVVDALLNAFHGLEPWDDFADPEYLDKLLLPPATRPQGVKLIKSN